MMSTSMQRPCKAFIVEGQVVLIDAEDWPRVKRYTWYISPRGYVQSGTDWLHRFVMNYDGPETIDHLHHDKLDNRKAELMVRSYSNNSRNVTWAARTKYRAMCSPAHRWQASVKVLGRNLYLGSFRTQRRAQIFAERATRDLLSGKTTIRAYKKPRYAKNARTVRVYMHVEAAKLAA